MKQVSVFVAIVLLAACRLFAGEVTLVSSPEISNGPWSETVNGLQARLSLVEKQPKHGVRWLVPYVELRNVRDLMNAMEVNCSREYFTVELVDKDGFVLRSGWALPRSGPAPELPTVILPFNSFMRISLECIPVPWSIDSKM